MARILLSTTSLWNCGDDFIREGVLNLLQLRQGVQTIWWNRGFGISPSYANDIHVNLQHVDYFIVAGTPQWVMLNERIFEECLRRGIGIAIIGVGTRGIINSAHRSLMMKVASSDLCEIALARDKPALDSLTELGFKNASLILDPAFFATRLCSEKTQTIYGWRDFRITTRDPRFPIQHPFKWLRHKQIDFLNQRHNENIINDYNKMMVTLFDAMQGEKIVLVHDNREISMASSLFGSNNVYYYSDYQDVFRVYSSAKAYIGSRIHGAIPSLIHGAPVHLIYRDPRYHVLSAAKEILEKYISNIKESITVDIVDAKRTYGLATQTLQGTIDLSVALETESRRVRKLLLQAKTLSSFLNI